MPQPVTGAERICVSFRDQSADWSWESVIPLHKSKGDADCHSQCAHWLRNDREFYKGCGRAGRCGERTERCQWQMKRGERVAAVKISSVRRKAAQKFWAPQQDHRPLRGYKGCNGRATARVAPTEGYKGCDGRAVGDAGPYGGLQGVPACGGGLLRCIRGAFCSARRYYGPPGLRFGPDRDRR